MDEVNANQPSNPSQPLKRKARRSLRCIQRCSCEACPACNVRSTVLSAVQDDRIIQATPKKRSKSAHTNLSNLTKFAPYQGFKLHKIAERIQAFEAMPNKAYGFFVHATGSDRPAKEGFKLDFVKHGRRYGQGVYLTLPTPNNLKFARHYGPKLVLALAVWSSTDVLDEHKPQWVPSRDYLLQHQDVIVPPNGALFTTKPGSTFIEAVFPPMQVIPLNVLPCDLPDTLVAQIPLTWLELLKFLNLDLGVFQTSYSVSSNHVKALHQQQLQHLQQLQKAV